MTCRAVLLNFDIDTVTMLTLRGDVKIQSGLAAQDRGCLLADKVCSNWSLLVPVCQPHEQQTIGS